MGVVVFVGGAFGVLKYMGIMASPARTSLRDSRLRITDVFQYSVFRNLYSNCAAAFSNAQPSNLHTFFTSSLLIYLQPQIQGIIKGDMT